jgi:DNA repair exonuclease SbcCD ATPase subunit
LVIGTNGAGKSTFIDALTYALYGKAFRNINKPQLVNSITQKNLVVEIEFKINTKRYLVRRGMKPNLFEIFINGNLLNQTADAREYQEYLETQVLKMNFKAFSQIVILGKANYVPFMQLPAHHRREVIEDLLDIQIFSRMNLLLKEDISKNKEDVVTNDYDVKLVNHTIDLHKSHLESLKRNNDEVIAQKRLKIAELEDQIVETEKVIDQLEATKQDIIMGIRDEQKVNARYENLSHYKLKFESKVEAIDKDITFFDNNDNCPTCKQAIDELFKQEAVGRRYNKMFEYNDALKKVDVELPKLEKRLAEIRTAKVSFDKANIDISIQKSKLTSFKSSITSIQTEIAGLSTEEHLETNMDTIQEQYVQLNRLSKEREKLLVYRNTLEVAAQLLKDSGIKTKIIRQYIPIINKLINKYLAQMEFFVNIELNEKFEETIKSRHRDEFTYSSFSEGEKLRIDVALMFAWRAIAKLKNSAATNLLILDEIFESSLDANGTDEFLRILDELTVDTNVFVISHHGDTLFDKFHSVVKFDKVKSFSRMVV